MAAGTQVFTNLNSRKVLSTTCLCLFAVFLITQIGLAFTFVIGSVISIALLWYFWTQTWFRPFDSREFVSGKRVSNAGPREFSQPGQSPETDYTPPAEEEWKQSRHEQSIDWTKNLTRKPLRARRTNANADNRFVNGGRNNLDESANIFNSMNKSRRDNSFILSPSRGRGHGNGSGLQQGFGNLTYAALAGSTPKSLMSPRDNMSFRLV